MELIIIAVLAIMLPIMTITAFVIGYNCNAPKKAKENYFDKMFPEWAKTKKGSKGRGRLRVV